VSGPASHPFRAYVAPAAAGRTALWRLAAGLVVVLAVWFGWTTIVFAAHAALLAAAGVPGDLAIARTEGLLAGGSPRAVALVLLTFAGLWAGLALALGLLHGRGVAGVLAAPGRFQWGEMAAGAAMAAAFFALSTAIGLAVAGVPERSDLAPAVWLGWLPVIGLLVLMQAGAEEALFRGYLVQGLAARGLPAIVWGGAPALLFGVLHQTGGLPGASGALYPVATAIFAVAATVLVWRTGSLAAAIGLHAGVNVLGLGVLGVEGVVSGAQLWTWDGAEAAGLLAGDTVASLLLLAFVVSPFCPVGARG
jgi:hypothetical protein